MRLDTHHTLPDGTRLRLRLPQARDRADIVQLLTRLGLTADELDVSRTLRFDPKARAVICATVWTGNTAMMAGIVTGTRDGAAADLLVADEALTPGVGAVLLAMLDATSSRRQAA